MHGLEQLKQNNTEITIRGILARAEQRGLSLTRADVLEELKLFEDDDTSVWTATVDRMMGVQS